LFVDLDLDGQAMAVEAGHIGRVETCHRLRFDDEVFEAVVERVAQVHGAVGIGRSVVEEVGWATDAGLAQLVIKAQRGPAGQAERFILR
jgi:hypothetical protein